MALLPKLRSGCNGDRVGEAERNLTSLFSLSRQWKHCTPFLWFYKWGRWNVSLRFEEFARCFQRARAKATAHALTCGPSLWTFTPAVVPYRDGQNFSPVNVPDSWISEWSQPSPFPASAFCHSCGEFRVWGQLLFPCLGFSLAWFCLGGATLPTQSLDLENHFWTLPLTWPFYLVCHHNLWLSHSPPLPIFWQNLGKIMSTLNENWAHINALLFFLLSARPPWFGPYSPFQKSCTRWPSPISQ